MKTKKQMLQELIDAKNPALMINKLQADKALAELILKMDTITGPIGPDGYTPVKGVDYYTEEEINSIISYIQSRVRHGEKGDKGDSIKGDTGYSPRKGVDYWTSKDQEKIIRDVLGSIPKPKEDKPINVDEVIQAVVEKIPRVNYKEEIGKILSTPGMRMLLHGGGLSTVAVDGVTITGDGTPGNPLVGTAASDTYKLKISAADTTGGYGEDKILAGTGITVTKGNTGGNETLTIAAPGSSTDEKVKYDAADPTAGYVADKIIAGTGISVAEGSGATENKLVVTNSAPDQTVAISAGTGISTSGTYPNFTVTNSAPDQTVAITGGTGISTGGTYPNLTVTNTAPDQTVAITDSGVAVVTGTYPNFNVDVPDQTYTLPTASYSVLGGIKVGSTLGIVAGVLDYTNPNPTPYTLPVASASVLGGVKQGTNISIDANGVISSTASGTGDVVGPSSAVDGNFASYDTTTGKLIKDSGSKASDFYLASNPNGYTSNVGTWTDSSTSTGTNKTLNSNTNYIDADATHQKVFLNLGRAGVVGDAVYVGAWNVANGCSEVSLARANSQTTLPCAGILESAGADGTVVSMRVEGILTGVNTNAWSEGTRLYVSAATAGALTSTRPTTPNFVQAVATVSFQSATVGVLDVIRTAYVGTMAYADTATYYLASNPSGYTNNTGTVTSVAALTLGTTGTDLSSSVATGTTTPVITLNVPTASSSNRGALSAADWSTFNGKQAAISFGTGVLTALGVNVGTAGSPLVNGDVLGTPSSGTVTNLTGTASININGTVGATTATTGKFTTLESTNIAALTTIAESWIGPSSTTGIYFKGGNVGIGTTTPNAGLEILKTTEQLRLSYDATHYSSFTVNSAGDLTLVGGTTAKLTATTFVGALTGTASGNLPLSGGTMTGTITLVTGTTTVAPIKMVAGTNLTTPVAGVIEFDGTDFFISV